MASTVTVRDSVLHMGRRERGGEEGGGGSACTTDSKQVCTILQVFGMHGSQIQAYDISCSGVLVGTPKFINIVACH